MLKSGYRAFEVFCPHWGACLDSRKQSVSLSIINLIPKGVCKRHLKFPLFVIDFYSPLLIKGIGISPCGSRVLIWFCNHLGHLDLFVLPQVGVGQTLFQISETIFKSRFLIMKYTVYRHKPVGVIHERMRAVVLSVCQCQIHIITASYSFIDDFLLHLGKSSGYSPLYCLMQELILGLEHRFI